MQNLPVGDNGQPPQEEPAPPVDCEWSLFEKHDGELRFSGKDYKKAFLDFLGELINLKNLPEEKEFRKLARSYCTVYDSTYQVLRNCLSGIEGSPRHLLHLQALSGLMLEKVCTGKEYVVVHYFEEPGLKGVYMIKHDPKVACPTQRLLSKEGFIKVTTAQLLQNEYRLVNFSSRSSASRVLGDVPPVQKRYVPKRHLKKDKKKRPQPGSDDEHAPLDREACLADQATLADGPAPGQGRRAPRQGCAQGGARAAGASGSAGGSGGGPEAAGGARIDEEDCKSWLTTLFSSFNASFIAEHVPPERVPDFFAALKQQSQKYQDEYARLNPSEHLQALALLRQEAKRQAQMDPAGALVPARRSVALHLAPDLSIHYPIISGFERFIRDRFDVRSEEEHAAAQAQPRGPASVNPEGPARHRKPRLERPLEDYRVPPDSKYLHLCYVPPPRSGAGVAHNIIALTLSPRMTQNWDDSGSDTAVRYVVLMDEELYKGLPAYVRDQIYTDRSTLADEDIQYLYMKGVEEVGDLLDTQWMDKLYHTALPQIHAMCEEQIDQRLRWQGKTIRETLEGLFLPKIQNRVRRENKQAEAAAKKRRADLAKRAEFEELPATSRREKKKPRIGLVERLNGYEELEPCEVPTKLELKLRVYCFTPMCVGNLGGEHGTMCPLNGFRNPVAHPFYARYAETASRGDARLMNCTMPRRFLDGLLSCRCLCDVHARVLPPRK